MTTPLPFALVATLPLMQVPLEATLARLLAGFT